MTSDAPHDDRRPSPSVNNPDAPIVDDLQLSHSPDRPPVHGDLFGLGPSRDSSSGPTPSPRFPRRPRLRWGSNSTMGLVIVALGTLIGLAMRVVLPDVQLGDQPLPAIKTPPQEVPTPDLEKVKP